MAVNLESELRELRLRFYASNREIERLTTEGAAKDAVIEAARGVETPHWYQGWRVHLPGLYGLKVALRQYDDPASSSRESPDA